MTRVLTATTIAATRSPWAWLLLPGLIVVALYAPLAPQLIQEWLEFPNLSHGPAIPFIAGYLLWARRSRLADLTPTPSLMGLPILVAGLAGLVTGVLGQESFIARMSLPITLFGLTLFLAGREVGWLSWPAIAYLVFMIPLPWTTLKLLTYRSRLFDATLTANIVSALGVPILQDGVVLHLPNAALEVADECSSVPAIAALVALAIAYAVLMRRSRLQKGILIAAGLPFAVASNIIRLVTTVGGVYYIGTVTLRSVYHQFAGTVTFLLTLLLLIALDVLLNRSLQGRTG